MARKILLADDSVTAQNMGRKILADAGYEVIAVNNGSAALKKIAELKPDLVILDVYMPGYSGLEVCQRLKESQETARIPVLLSVGKLEPFKPEEAQRVRADGYIVKPFEASELLSALSKLEDKVVPRAEPSKPGRFARAIAAAKESDRDSRNQTAGEQNGWKSRIGFPHDKTEPAEKVAEEASIYNPMNRDLRTVVETAGEKAAEKTRQERGPAEAAAETSVDVAALAAEGLPKDVTPEEVAAIAAAAAQIQMAGAALEDEHRTSEAQTTEAQRSEIQVAETTRQESPGAAPGSVELSGSSSPDVLPGKRLESLAEQTATANTYRRRSGDQIPESQDLPVTMAATAESVAASAGTSRWTAVPAALEGEEANISLDQEMQKAYAAAETNSARLASVPEAQTAPAENSSAEAAVETPVAVISDPERNPIPEAEPNEPNKMGTGTIQAEPPATAQFEAAVPSVEADGAPHATAEAAPAETNTGISPATEFAGPNPEPTRVAEFMSPVSEAEVARLAGIVGLSAESQLATEAAMSEATTSAQSGAFAPIPGAADQAGEDAPEPIANSETVKSTAAAWASWRQIQDTNGSQAVPGQPQEVEVPESAPAEAARAVAAGAEQILQEAQANAPSGNPADVASIVDSVLADLRPKLMAEISRKMAEKK